jgi:hypothetical protein
LIASSFAPINSTPYFSRTPLSVFRLLDRLQFRPDQFDAVLLQNPALRQRHRGVQGSLSSHRWEDRVRPFPFNDLFNKLGGDGFDVRPIRKFGIGHNRRGIAVDQDNPVPFFA